MKKSFRTMLIISGILMAFAASAISCKKDSGNTNSGTPQTSNVPDEIVGTWYYGDVSSTEIYSNGTWSNAVGSGQYYTFNKNGTFEFGYRNYAMVGTCSNEGMAYRKGTFTVDGNTLTLYDNYAKMMEQHSCDPSSNYDKDMEKTTGEKIVAQPGTDELGTNGLYLSYPGGNPSFFAKK